MASNGTAAQHVDPQGHEGRAQRYDRRILSDEAERHITPGLYMQDYYNQDGDKISRLGMFINLYISKKILDIEFSLFVHGHETKTFIPKVVGGDGRFQDGDPVKYGEGCYSVLVELVLRGGPITMDDMIHGMATKKIGRLILSQFVTPPMRYSIGLSQRLMVKDYYVIADGIRSVIPPNIRTDTTGMFKYMKSNAAQHENCPICFNDDHSKSNYMVETICKHKFHDNCLNKWLIEKPTCPCCRNSLSYEPSDDPSADPSGQPFAADPSGQSIAAQHEENDMAEFLYNLAHPTWPEPTPTEEERAMGIVAII